MAMVASFCARRLGETQTGRPERLLPRFL